MDNDTSTDLMERALRRPADTRPRTALAKFLMNQGDLRGEVLKLVTELTRPRGGSDRAGRERSLIRLLEELQAEGIRPLVVGMENGIGMALALIPPGEFLMGSPESEAERSYQEVQHRVRLTRPFYLGTHEVTVGQFRQFVKATGYRTEAELDGKGAPGYAATGQTIGPKPRYTWRSYGRRQTKLHPVVNVTWNDAVRFCEWLSQLEHRTYRLPTEAEWEYACRAGTRSTTHFGDSMSSHQANFNGRFPCGLAPRGPALGRPVAVGSYFPNGFGLWDMHGNVWEWCRYAYHEKRSGVTVDPDDCARGWFCVLRGGSCRELGKFCRAAFRKAIGPARRDVHIGFRVACAVGGGGANA